MRLAKPISLKDLPKSSNDFDILPEGQYLARIDDVKVDFGKNKPQNRQMIISMVVADGKHAKRFLPRTYIVIESPNHEDLARGQENLRKLMEACGMDSFEDTNDFIGHQVLVKVKHKADPNYNDGQPQANISSIKAAPKAADSSNSNSSDDLPF